MKHLIILITAFSIISLSFQKQDKVGKQIFDNNCKSCHLPNKSTQFAPSFQQIRKDYGLQWTLAFIKDSRKMMDEKDLQTLYSYYLFGKKRHILFPILEAKNVVKVLDYVDGFPVDTLQFKHRHTSYSEKLTFVNDQLAKDTVK